MYYLNENKMCDARIILINPRRYTHFTCDQFNLIRLGTNRYSSGVIYDMSNMYKLSIGDGSIVSNKLTSIELLQII